MIFVIFRNDLKMEFGIFTTVPTGVLVHPSLFNYSVPESRASSGSGSWAD